MGLIYCAIAVAFFSAFYLLLGRSQKKGNNALGVNFAAFLAGAALSLLPVLPLRAAQFPTAIVQIGALIGVAAGLGLLGVVMAVRSGVALTVVNTGVSLSLAVPVLLALAFYGETPSPRKWLGIAFAAAAIVLIQKERR